MSEQVDEGADAAARTTSYLNDATTRRRTRRTRRRTTSTQARRTRKQRRRADRAGDILHPS